jgi:GMP synthase-like glutamine amidotransferase
MKALIIQHEKDTPPGSTLDWLKLKKIPFEIVFPSEGLPPVLQDNFDFLIICGGSMNVDEEDLHPWLREEKKLISDFIKANKKIVGLCLGGQLLAEALGGKVQKCPFMEIGWQLVQMENNQSLIVFQWHSYHFTLPPQARLLAFNRVCDCQGFIHHGENILGLQFHPETTLEWALECASDPKLPEKSPFIQSSDEIKRDVIHLPKMQEWYFSQLNSLIGDI